MPSSALIGFTECDALWRQGQKFSWCLQDLGDSSSYLDRWTEDLYNHSLSITGQLQQLLVGCHSVGICFSLKLYAQFLIPTTLVLGSRI